MYFEEALALYRKDDNKETHCIRRKEWKEDVEIRWMPDRLYSSHLAVFSRFGAIPWIPTMVEILLNDDWEYKESKQRDELCKNVSDTKSQIRKMQKEALERHKS